MHQALIVSLSVMAAVGQVVGTTSVAVAYWRSHQLALDLAARASAQGPVRQTNLGDLLDPLQGSMRAWDTEGGLQALTARVASQLRARWWQTGGLAAFGVSAAAGLAAVLLAVWT